MDDMNRPRQVPASPSPRADFPVYGLDAAWHGSRWLESFGEAASRERTGTDGQELSRDIGTSLWADS